MCIHKPYRTIQLLLLILTALSPIQLVTATPPAIIIPDEEIVIIPLDESIVVDTIPITHTESDPRIVRVEERYATALLNGEEISRLDLLIDELMQ